MLRVALLGIVMLASACHRKDDAGGTVMEASGSGSEALVTTVAGTVRAVSGSVTVAGKPLTVGDRLAAGDVVVTGDHSSTLIELTHNGAKWELGPSRSVRVADSIAWKLTPAQATALAVVRDMAQPNVGSGAGGSAPPPAPTTPQGAAAILMVRRGELMRCLASTSASVQLLVKVDATGQAKVDTPGAPDDVHACLAAEVAKLKFPAKEAGVGVTLQK